MGNRLRSVRVCLVALMILTSGTFSFSPMVQAITFPDGTFKIDNSGSNGAITGKIVRSSWPTVVVDVHNDHSFWTEISVFGSSAIKSVSKSNIWAQLGYIAPDSGARFAITFDNNYSSGYIQLFANGGRPQDGGYPVAGVLTTTTRAVDLLLSLVNSPVKVKNLHVDEILRLVDIFTRIPSCVSAVEILNRQESGGFQKFADQFRKCFLDENNARAIAIGLNHILERLALGLHISSNLIKKTLTAIKVFDLASDAFDTLRAIVTNSWAGSVVVNARTLCTNPIPGPTQAVLFTEPNFKGKCTLHGLGDFGTVDRMRIADDSVSSVRVGINAELTLYPELNFGGLPESFIQDDADLSDNAIGDNDVSSFSVRRPAGDYRIVLSWGEQPSDIDSHLWLPSNTPFHVYYADKGTSDGFPWASLDIDDTTSFGPETIQIVDVQPGNYVYAVHNFTGRYGGAPYLSESGATVKLFHGSTLLRTYSVPTSGTETWWEVFRLSSDGTITDVNALVTSPSVEYFAASDIGDDKTPLSQSVPSPTSTATEPPTAEPSPTQTPTLEPTPVPTEPATPEPAPTDSPTAEASPTDSPTAEPPAAEPSPTDTPVPAASAGA